MDVNNLSNNSSDPEMISLQPPGRSATLDGVRPLWSRPGDEEIFSMAAPQAALFQSRNRTTSPDDFPPASIKKSTRSRRSIREVSDREGEGESRRGKDHRRLRSRSHGRPHPPPVFVDQFYPPYHQPSPFYTAAVQPMYYSSGGSNGGRSPPPEMPLISGVPPPGLVKMPQARSKKSRDQGKQ